MFFDNVGSRYVTLDNVRTVAILWQRFRVEWKGFHSVRINEQWRVVFRWEGGNALDVQIPDYH